jgi:hypothetical protein
MKPFARWSEAELQARFDSLTAQVEAANEARMDLIMFELLDESTALAAILGRRRGGSTYAALQDHPPAEDPPFAVYVDEDEQELPKLPTQRGPRVIIEVRSMASKARSRKSICGSITGFRAASACLAWRPGGSDKAKPLYGRALRIPLHAMMTGSSSMISKVLFGF